jgi:hypothetical protein
MTYCSILGGASGSAMFSSSVRRVLRSYRDFMPASHAATRASPGSAMASTQRRGRSAETAARRIVAPRCRAGE